MAEQAQNRNLPASARKIAKARSEGQVARSRDLGHLAALGLGGALLIAFAPRLVELLRGLLEAGLRFDSGSLAAAGVMPERLREFAGRMLLVVAPLGAVMIAAALAAGVAAGGWNFTWKPLEPDLKKVDPLAGLARLFSAHALGDTLKSCLLAAVLLALGALLLQLELPRFVALAGMPLPTALVAAGELLRLALYVLIGALAGFALVDVPLQRFLLLRRLRMSPDEARKEMKDVEGNLEVKAKIRARMRALASRRMLAAVPGADLVVMNPTHYAVALKYDDSLMAAPRVVAKGADLLALRIRDAAVAAKVPVLQAPPLARALYAHTEVDREIPAALFSAVAQVLAWVYQLRAAAGDAARTLAPPQVQVPPELDPATTRGDSA